MLDYTTLAFLSADHRAELLRESETDHLAAQAAVPAPDRSRERDRMAARIRGLLTHSTRGGWLPPRQMRPAKPLN